MSGERPIKFKCGLRYLIFNNSLFLPSPIEVLVTEISPTERYFKSMELGWHLTAKWNILELLRPISDEEWEWLLFYIDHGYIFSSSVEGKYLNLSKNLSPG